MSWRPEVIMSYIFLRKKHLKHGPTKNTLNVTPTNAFSPSNDKNVSNNLFSEQGKV
jgi:hypothetical protein